MEIPNERDPSSTERRCLIAQRLRESSTALVDALNDDDDIGASDSVSRSAYERFFGKRGSAHLPTSVLVEGRDDRRRGRDVIAANRASVTLAAPRVCRLRYLQI